MVESEKKIEKALNAEVKKRGGWSIKFLPYLVAGLPDRLCFLPNGRLLMVEVKTTGQDTRPVQKLIIKKFRDLGFTVAIIDRTEQINKILDDFNRE